MKLIKVIASAVICIVLFFGIILYVLYIKNIPEKKINVVAEYEIIKDKDILAGQFYEEKDRAFPIYCILCCEASTHDISLIKKDPKIKDIINNFNETVKLFINKVNKSNNQINLFQFSPAYLSDICIVKRNRISKYMHYDLKVETKFGLKYNIFNNDLCNKIAKIEYVNFNFNNDGELIKLTFLDKNNKELFMFK